MEKKNGYGAVSYSNLGRIKPGLTYAEIRTLGEEYADANPKYSYSGIGGNNCRTFANALYNLIRA